MRGLRTSAQIGKQAFFLRNAVNDRITIDVFLFGRAVEKLPIKRNALGENCCHPPPCCDCCVNRRSIGALIAKGRNPLPTAPALAAPTGLLPASDRANAL